MKSFYAEHAPGTHSVMAHSISEVATPSYIGTRARVAVYDGPASAPFVEDISPAPAREYIESLSSRVFDLARQRGGSVPYTVIRELAENLLHARFADPVISILDHGRTISFSDRGPGIPDKARALRPGFTTATASMKDIIRGVGSGLPIVSDFLAATGGSLSIEDNLSGGSVVTITHASERPPVPVIADEESERVVLPAAPPTPSGGAAFAPPVSSAASLFDAPADEVRLSTRQKHVLALVLETGLAGPSIVSKELGIGLSTAYRDLASLEEMGLITSEGGKRTLTEDGSSLLGKLMASVPAT